MQILPPRKPSFGTAFYVYWRWRVWLDGVKTSAWTRIRNQGGERFCHFSGRADCLLCWPRRHRFSTLVRAASVRGGRCK